MNVDLAIRPLRVQEYHYELKWKIPDNMDVCSVIKFIVLLGLWEIGDRRGRIIRMLGSFQKARHIVGHTP